MKEKLEAFGQKQFLHYFQMCVSARPHQVKTKSKIAPKINQIYMDHAGTATDINKTHQQEVTLLC